MPCCRLAGQQSLPAGKSNMQIEAQPCSQAQLGAEGASRRAHAGRTSRPCFTCLCTVGCPTCQSVDCQQSLRLILLFAPCPTMPLQRGRRAEPVHHGGSPDAAVRRAARGLYQQAGPGGWLGAGMQPELRWQPVSGLGFGVRGPGCWQAPPMPRRSALQAPAQIAQQLHLILYPALPNRPCRRAPTPGRSSARCGRSCA